VIPNIHTCTDYSQCCCVWLLSSAYVSPQFAVCVVTALLVVYVEAQRTKLQAVVQRHNSKRGLCITFPCSLALS
jgi:hypothetical protein